MKTSKKFVVMLALAGSATALASCAKTVTNSCYAKDAGGNYCTYVIKATASVNNDYLTATSVNAIASVSTWARISADKATELGADREGYDYIKVSNVTDYDGTTGKTIYYAKHISLGGNNWTAHVRDSDELDDAWKGEEYVCYCLDTVEANGTSLAYDMCVYLDSSSNVDTGRYKLGSLFQEYYDAIASGNVHLLKETNRVQNDGLTNGYTFTYATDDLAAITYVGGDGTSPYRCNWDTKWKNASEKVCSVCLNTLKRLNFSSYLRDEDDNRVPTYRTEDGEYQYNPTFVAGKPASYYESEEGWVTFEGVSPSAMPVQSFLSVMTSLSWAYAAGEYSSIR